MPSDSFHTRLEEWAEWFVFNHDRLALYYHGQETRAQRYAFQRTMVDGVYELCALVLQGIRDLWQQYYEVDMSDALVHRIKQDVAWFYRHKDTIIDPDKQYDFLVQTQGKVLQLCRMMGEELDRLDRGATYERVARDDAAAVGR